MGGFVNKSTVTVPGISRKQAFPLKTRKLKLGKHLFQIPLIDLGCLVLLSREQHINEVSLNLYFVLSQIVQSGQLAQLT